MGNRLTIGNILYSKFYLYIVSAIVLLDTCYLEFLSPVDSIVSTLAYGICVINFLLFLICFKFDKFSISILVFGFFLLISTVFMSSSIVGFFKYYFNIISYTLYLNLNFKKDAKKTISVLNSTFFVLIFINFLTILISPSGMYSTIRYSNNWFYRNRHTQKSERRKASNSAPAGNDASYNGLRQPQSSPPPLFQQVLSEKYSHSGSSGERLRNTTTGKAKALAGDYPDGSGPTHRKWQPPPSGIDRLF